jgi:hypothetical protein
MQLASVLQAKIKWKESMSLNNFLDSTKETQTSTKMAAAASRAMEGQTKAVRWELGAFGG